MPSSADPDAPSTSTTSGGNSAHLSAHTDEPSQVRANLVWPPYSARNGRAPAMPAYRAPLFPHAAQPEIIRANQKDLYYLTQLQDQIEEVARNVFGTRWLQGLSEEIGIASKMIYYGLTTFLGTQTLGEEYVDILQYSTRTKKIPTLLARTLLLSSHVLAPYLLARLYTRLKRQLAARRSNAQASSSTSSLSASSSPDSLFADEDSHTLTATAPPPPPAPTRFPLSSLLSDIELPSFTSLIDENLRAVHLAVFYLFGRYYHVAKRLLGIRYLSLQMRPGAGAEGGTRPPSYEVLGVLMAVQLGVRLTSVILRKRKERKAALEATRSLSEKEEAPAPKRAPVLVDGQPLSSLIFDPDETTPEEEEDDADVVQSRRCTLCLGPRKDPAATECGHTFCFTCIVGYCTQEKAECPLCRQKVKLERILPLYNV